MNDDDVLEMLEQHCELCRNRLFFDESECMFCQYFKAMEAIKRDDERETAD